MTQSPKITNDKTSIDTPNNNTEPKTCEPLTMQQIEDGVVRRISQAPLRTTGSFDFDVPPEVLFPYVSEPAKLAEWFPLIKGGGSDHGTSCAVGDWGEGSTRTCLTNGMGTITEDIHYWDGPYGSVYAPRSMMMPTKNYVAVMTLAANGRGGTTFTWNHYFNLKGMMMRFMFPTMMLAMMNMGLNSLVKKLGGQGGRIHKV